MIQRKLWKKIKLLTPILSATVLAGIVLPMTSCGCTNNEDSAIKESIYFKKEQTIDSYARYILVLDKDTYNNKDVTIKLSGEGSEKFIVSSFISGNMLVIDVTPTELPEDETVTYKFNLNVKVGDNSKEFANLVINVNPVPEEPTVNENLKYRFDSGTQSYFAYCNLQAEEEKAAWEVKKLYLPDTYDDGENGVHPVGGIDDGGFYDCTSIKKVTLPETIKTIGYYAFHCTRVNEDETASTCNGQIEKIVFLGTSQLETLQDGAFYGQSKLTEIFIPKSVKNIGSSVFECVDYEETEYKYAETTTGSLKKVTIEEESNLTTIGNWAFSGQKELESFDLPDSVTQISRKAFYCSDCYWNEDEDWRYTPTGKISKFNIDLGNSKLTTINEMAFFGQSQLASINIPNNCINIGSYTDWRTSTTYASNPFVLCSNLKTFNVSTSNQSVKASSDNSMLFACSDAQSHDRWTLVSYPSASGSISIDYPVQIIGPYAFMYNDKITSVQITNQSTTKIGPEPFLYCNNLNKIIIGENVEYISDEAFEYAPNLVDFIVNPYNTHFTSIQKDSHYSLLLSIEDSTHKKLWSYPSAKGAIDLSSSEYDAITSVGTYCFIDVPITSFKANSNTTKICYEAFRYCDDLQTVDFNMASEIGTDVFEYCNVQEMKVNSNNQTYETRNSGKILVRTANKKLEIYLANNGQDVDFSDNNVYLKDIQIIGMSAFWNYVYTPINLKDLGNVVELESQAFWDLTFANSTLTIPATLTKINSLAFENQNGIESIVFEKTDKWSLPSGYPIDVSNPEENAVYLTDPNNEWCYNGIVYNS